MKIVLFPVVFLCGVLIASGGNDIGFVLKDLLRSPASKEKRIIQVGNRDGYTIEEHYVTTVDGYIIKMHRIPPYGRKSSSKNRRGNVYMVHGLLGNSDSWLVSGVGKSIGYLLADIGYDVWMANCRGSFHSRRHRTLSINSHQFWDFSWHEIGIYDHPANIDYILNRTNEVSLHYIGHSQGTTSFFVLTSMLPEYNRKIRTMHALSPVAFMSHIESPIFRLPAFFQGLISILADSFGLKEFIPNTSIVEILGKKLCRNRSQYNNFCANVLFVMGGFNPKQFNTTLAPEIFTTVPAGSSVYQFLHYLQGVLSGHFRMFDRGKLRNLLRYGSPTPPDYPLQRVSAPVYLYYSTNDWISAVEDVNILLGKLSSVAGKTLVADRQWAHFDYVWGIQAKELVYDIVIRRMNDYEQKYLKLG